MSPQGEYGGVVNREFFGEGKKWLAGAVITPEIANAWPLANRIALAKSGKVVWYGPPSEQEQAAREAGKPAPARRPSSAAKKTATPDTPKPTRGSRRTTTPK